MKDLTRLIISNERIKNLQNKEIKLSAEESHYLNRVMRTKTGDQISIINGKGYLWRGIKKNNNFIEIPQINSPIYFQNKKKLLLGIAIAIPKSGFEDILKMCTEIGIDFIQPLYSEHQIKRTSNFNIKMIRWNKIINESVEQCERLWKPELLDILDIYEWINSQKDRNLVSVSVTRSDNCISLKKWLGKQTFSNKEFPTFWNIIGPEGGWSLNELCFFKDNNIQFIKLSETILRTSTAAINATSILNQWRNFDMKSLNSI
tara:strand:+ start:2177 stop:2956 length:780 start_codon:yes stop_codon:yes gene_type:complete